MIENKTPDWGRAAIAAARDCRPDAGIGWATSLVLVGLAAVMTYAAGVVLAQRGADRAAEAALIAGAPPPKVPPSPPTGDRGPEKAPPPPTYGGQPLPPPPPVRK